MDLEATAGCSKDSPKKMTSPVFVASPHDYVTIVILETLGELENIK